MHLDHLPGSFFGPSNLVDLLRHRALHQAKDRGFIFLVDGEDEEINLTYDEIDRKARAIGAMLQSMNMEGERALLLYPTGLDFVAAFFGCLYANVTAVPAYPPRRNRNMSRVEAIANDANAKVALTTYTVLERVQTVINEMRDLQTLQWVATDHVADGLEDQWQMPDVHGDTLAFLQYTSGSTGTPKGVTLTHANLMHNSAMIAYAFEHTRSGNGVFWLPLYHDMGLIGGILQPLYIGQANVLFSPAQFLQKPYRWLSAISKYRSTISGGPNFAFDLCVDKITEEQKATLDLSRWVVAFNGAEPVRSETIERFVKAFEPCGFRREAFYPCYGLAEATLIVAGGFKDAAAVIRSVQSKALENHEVRPVPPHQNGCRELVGSGGNLLDQQIVIVDPETMTCCADDRVGEIWVSGPSVAEGYWKRPEETRHTFEAYLQDTGAGPFLRTGDLGFLLDGELFITGRLKDLIIVRGVNYYPQDIENTVEHCHEHLRPAAGASFTVDEGGREQLVIVHEAARRRDLNFSEIFKAIRSRIATAHDLQVDAIILLKAGSIPKTSSGKIQRHACRAGFLNGSLAGIGQWRSGDAVEPAVVAATEISATDRAEAPPATTVEPGSTAEIVYQHVRDVAKERAGKLTLESNIVELGLDSLERMEIVAALEETFGGRFPEQILPDMETCAQVVEAVEQYLGSEARQKVERSTDYDVPEENYNFGRFPEYQQLKQNFEILESAGLPNPFFKVHQRVTRDTTMIEGKELINFASFNYLGMSGDPVVGHAAKEAITRFGTSVSASRLVSGERSVHRELECAIADFIGTADTIVYVGGHSTNESTIGHLLGPGDLILHDALAHNSIVQGSMLSGARRRPFPHNDWAACDKLLKELRHEYRRVLIAMEGVYSMDGDYPDLPKFVEVKKRHKALLLIDEAHSIGTMGRHGRGMSEHFQVDPRDVDLWMGTLSKAFGSCGGYISGCKEVVEYLKYTAPAFVFSVGLSPSNAAAALAALRLLEEEPERVAKLHRNSGLFLRLAKARRLNTGTSHGTPIIPVIVGNSANSLLLSRRMYERGINVQPIVHPAVEENAARLRFFIASSHTSEQIRSTVDAMTEEMMALDPSHFVPVAQQDHRRIAGRTASSRLRSQ